MQCSECGQRKGLSIPPCDLVIEAFISPAHLMEPNNRQQCYRETERTAAFYLQRQLQRVTLTGATAPLSTDVADRWTSPPKPHRAICWQLEPPTEGTAQLSQAAAKASPGQSCR